jgi:geranylgeranyl diphosphate/geranylgeranyl-bacteriochlorophyllide a reductase
MGGAKYKVAVIGGGPSGSCAAEVLAQNPNIECMIFERKMDNAKPCGGAIPLCMVDEFSLPSEIIDRKVSIYIYAYILIKHHFQRYCCS